MTLGIQHDHDEIMIDLRISGPALFGFVANLGGTKPWPGKRNPLTSGVGFVHLMDLPFGPPARALSAATERQTNPPLGGLCAGLTGATPPTNSLHITVVVHSQPPGRVSDQPRARTRPEKQPFITAERRASTHSPQPRGVVQRS